jgi:hypothetical protein
VFFFGKYGDKKMLKFEKIPQIPQTTKLGGKTKNKKKT